MQETNGSGRPAIVGFNSGDAVERAKKIAGGAGAFARALGVTRQAVGVWKRRRVPAERVPDIVALTKGQVTWEDLRPDLPQTWVAE